MMFTLQLHYVVAHCVLKFAKIFVSHSLPRPRYKYETSVSHNTATNGSEGALPCHANHTETTADESLDLVTRKGTVHSESGYDGLRFIQSSLNPVVSSSACEKSAGSSLWIYVFIGNMLRGIGETPIMPLGVSYLDDFSREENTPFYLCWFLYTPSCLHMAFFLLLTWASLAGTIF